MWDRTKVIAFKFAKDKRLKSGYLVYYAGNKHKIINVYKDNAAIVVYKDT
jgi:hypothetical protein